MTTALVLDGWHLEARGVCQTILDTDLAEHAELRVPRDIRRTIAKLIVDGALVDGVGGAHANDDPCFWLESTEVVNGKGRVEHVCSYRLNKTGALIVIGKLRTAKAVELQKIVVKVFAMAMDGRLVPAGSVGPAVAQALTGDQLDQLADRLGARLGEVLARQLDAQPTRTGLNVARLVKVKLVEIRDLMTDGMTRKQRSSVLGDLTVELRRRLGFFGTGCSFDNLSAEQWCKARVELEAMLRTAEKTAKRRQTELFGDPAPLSLGSPDPKGTN